MKLTPAASLVIAAGLAGCAMHGRGDSGAVGSGTDPRWSDREWIRRAGPLLDDVSRGLEQFGSITMSAPLLCPAPDPRFKFELKKNADDYFAEAKNPQASAASSQASAMEVGIGIKLQADLEMAREFKAAQQQYEADLKEYQSRVAAKEEANKAAAEYDALAKVAEAEGKGIAEQLKAQAAAERARAQGLPEPGTAPVRPQPPTGALPDVDAGLIPSADKSKAALGDAAMKGFQALVGTGEENSGISNQSAIQIAAANVATEGIFSLLADPTAESEFKDKALLLGVAMVNIRPGEVTRRGYAGDVAMRVSYRWQTARPDWPRPDATTGLTSGNKATSDSQDTKGRSDRGEANSPPGGVTLTPEDPNAADRSPLVFAVAPMIDADVLDLEYSYRRQRALALRIAAALKQAGMGAQAGIFSEFADRLENDLATRNVSAASTSYSMGGGIFGFQIGPRLRALADPTAKKPKPGYSLERQSFPVLLIIGIDKQDLVLQRAKENPAEWLEPTISFHQTSRWIPIEPASAIRLTETDRLRWLANLAQVQSDIDKRFPKSPAPPHAQDTLHAMHSGSSPAGVSTRGEAGHDAAGDLRNYMKLRTDVMYYEALSSGNSQDIPISLVTRLLDPKPPTKPNPVPQVNAVAPNALVADGNTELQVLIIGDHLEKVTAADVSAFPDAATGVLTVVPPPGPRGVLVKFKAPKTEQPQTVYFSITRPFPTDADKNATIRLVTPPIQLLPPPTQPKPPATMTLTVEKSGTPGAADKPAASKEIMTVPKDIPADVLKALIEKEKPAPAPPKKP